MTQCHEPEKLRLQAGWSAQNQPGHRDTEWLRQSIWIWLPRDQWDPWTSCFKTVVRAEQGAPESKKEAAANRLSTYGCARHRERNCVWIIIFNPHKHPSKVGAIIIWIQSILCKS